MMLKKLSLVILLNGIVFTTKYGKFYRVLGIFKKSFNKWRHERQGDKNEKLKVHLKVLETFHDNYQVHLGYHYICEDLSNLGTYIGHAININI